VKNQTSVVSKRKNVTAIKNTLFKRLHYRLYRQLGLAQIFFF